MAKLEFAFKRGDILSGEIFAEQIPETWKALKSFLPATLTILNARWSGREVHAQCLVPDRPPRENQTIYAGLGDIIYAREWPEVRDCTGFEAIAMFYVAETVRDWRGTFAVNHIGRLDPSQWELVQEIGNRIYRHVVEDCTIRVLED